MLGVAEGAAGSVYTPLLRDGAQVGYVRAINEGMLETPGVAFTAPVTSVQIGERVTACRWLPRTRLVGVTERRSFVIAEDADGDLIYTTFDFGNAATATPIDLTDNGRSTAFSIEVRGGEENVTPAGSEFRFANRGFDYIVRAPTGGAPELEVRRAGEIVQTEPLLAVQLATGAS